MAIQTFAAIADLARNKTFQRRLAVAITEHCRWHLDTEIGTTAPNVYAWRQALARAVLQLVGHEQHIERFARIVLLPADWGEAPDGFDPEVDAKLMSRVEVSFTKFASDAEPAPE